MQRLTGSVGQDFLCNRIIEDPILMQGKILNEILATLPKDEILAEKKTMPMAPNFWRVIQLLLDNLCSIRLSNLASICSLYSIRLIPSLKI